MKQSHAYSRLSHVHPKFYYDGHTLWCFVDAVEVSGQYCFDGLLVLQEWRGFVRWKERGMTALNRWGDTVYPRHHWGFCVPSSMK